MREGRSDEEPQEWARVALLDCLALGERLAPRLARRAARQQRCRDPVDDALALAARRVAPLPRRVLRPLPASTLPACARAFNGLDPADRRALLGWRPGLQAAQAPDAGVLPADVVARAEHLASALARLLAGARALERHGAVPSRPPRAGRSARGPAGKNSARHPDQG